MKLKTLTDGRTCFLSVYELLQIPCPHGAGEEAARQLCRDACGLAPRPGSLAVELLRVAGTERGEPMRHFLVLRGVSARREVCMELAKAFSACAAEVLCRFGYVFRTIPSDRFWEEMDGPCRDGTWGLSREEIREQDELSAGQHISLPVLGKVDWPGVYGILDGSGCTLSTQMIPRHYTPGEAEAVQRAFAACCRAAEGGILPLRDGLAGFARRRWNYYVERANAPMAVTNVIVSGPKERAALVAARIRGAVEDRHSGSAAPMGVVELTGRLKPDLWQLPWQYEAMLREKSAGATGTLCRILDLEEAGGLGAFPEGSQGAAAGARNPFSLLEETATVPGKGLMLGQTLKGTALHLPLEDVSMHVGIYGKSGFGKTTLELNLLEELGRQGVSALVLEPVKREYRNLARSGEVKVFTAEHGASPLLVNPFQPPAGVPLSEYRPHLVRAFQAAFSMPDPLPSLFGAAITECYALHNWKDGSRAGDPDVAVFGLSEFTLVFQSLLERSHYGGEVKGNMLSGGTFRLMSLLDRGRLTFETVSFTPVEDLLDGRVILELGRLEGEQKCLTAALVLISMLAYLRSTRDSGGPLRNVLVLDEAHVLLDNHSTTEEGKAAGEMMCSLIAAIQAEMRALGVGVVLADQSPNCMGSRLLDNCDTCLLFRLTGHEAALAARTLGLNQKEQEALTMLDVGQALVRSHRLNGVTGIYTRSREPEKPVSDGEVEALMRAYREEHSALYRPFIHCKLCPACDRDCSFGVRDRAATLAVQILQEREQYITDRESMQQHLLALPKSLHRQEDFSRLCQCTALHLYRKAAMERRELRLPGAQLAGVLARLARDTEEGEA